MNIRPYLQKNPFNLLISIFDIINMAFKITSMWGFQLSILHRAKETTGWFGSEDRNGCSVQWIKYWRSTKSGWHKACIAWSIFKNIAILLWDRIEGLLVGRDLIAIALTEHMGDIVAAQPIAAYVRARHPKARLVWVTRSSFNELVNAFGVIDRVISVQCITEWAMLRNSGIFSQHYDLHVNKRSCLICKKTIFRKNRKSTDRHRKLLQLRHAACHHVQNAGLPILRGWPWINNTGCDNQKDWRNRATWKTHCFAYPF